MKVDLVVNSMLQQIDRSLSLQTQLNPTVSYRVGELLRGQVSTGDGKMQIRLDNGRLLNALPSNGVLLSNGASVLLRVAGNMDGNLVMQLLAQEFDNRTPANDPVGQALQQMGIEADEQGRAVLQAMEHMQAEPTQENVRNALQMLERFPELGPEKAAFLAANHIDADRPQVDALIRLVDGRAMLGDELEELSGKLTAQLENLLPEGGEPPTAAPAVVIEQENAPPRQTEPPQINGAAQPVQQPTAQEFFPQEVFPTEALPQEAAVIQPEPDAEGWSIAAPAQGTGQGSELENTVPPSQPAVQTDQTQIPQAISLPERGEVEVSQTLPAGPEGAPQPAPQTVPNAAGNISEAVSPSEEDAPVAVPVAAGREAAPQQLAELVTLTVADGEPYPQAQAAIRASGRAEQAVTLALGLPTMPPEEAQEQMQQFLSTLPPAARPQAEAMLNAISSGIHKLLAGDDDGLPRQPGGLSRVIGDIAGMFVALDGNLEEKLARAVGEQRGKLAELTQRLESGDLNSRETAQQAGGITGQARLIHDISQYVYHQIPVQMNDKRKTVELYVLKRGGRSRRIDPSNANILIALDTDNIGHLETMINVNKKTIRLRFGVERGDLVGYLNGYLPDIGEAMKAIGYRLSDVRTQLIERPVNLLTVAETVEPQRAAGGLDIKV